MILSSKIHRITEINKNSAGKIPKWVSDIGALVGDEIEVTFDVSQSRLDKLPKVEIKNLRTGDTTEISAKFFSESIGWKKVVELKEL